MNVKSKKILVVGSSNMDMIAVCDRMPAPGETVGGARFMQAFGGKGANQAVAAARLGGNVSFLASLGDDLSGCAMKKHFLAEGIDTSLIRTDKENPTGTALILVDSRGENCIAVAPGANDTLSPDVVDAIDDDIKQADVLVMQAEIPYETVKAAALAARRYGTQVLFNPAPACQIDAQLMAALDILVLNKAEAEYISGMPVTESRLEKVARKLFAEGARNVVITLGSRGAYLYTFRGGESVPAFSVQAVDTTAAGDVFCGALAVSCREGVVTPEDLRFASAASAISVTRMGAQPSIPTLAETKEFLAQNKETLKIVDL